MAWLAAQGKLDDVGDMAAACDRAEKPDPTVLLAAAGLLSQSPSSRHLDRAEALYRRVREIAPDWLEGRWALANFLLDRGHPDAAERLFADMIRSNPKDARALNAQACLLADVRKDYSGALPLAERAVRLQPQNRHMLDTRAVVLSHLPGRGRDARADFLRCLKLAETPAGRASTRLRLARVCLDLGDPAEARRHVAEAEKIDRETHTLTGPQRKELADLLGRLPTPPS